MAVSVFNFQVRSLTEEAQQEALSLSALELRM
jgi:hypothetical protein